MSDISEIYKRAREMCDYLVKHDASLKETVDYFRSIGKYNIAVSTLYDDIQFHLGSDSELKAQVMQTLRRHYPEKAVHGKERGEKVVYLHDVEKHSFRQIGELLGISKASAVSDYHKHKDLEDKKMSATSRSLLYLNKKSKELLDSEEALIDYAYEHEIDPLYLKELLIELEQDSLMSLKDREDSNHTR